MRRPKPKPPTRTSGGLNREQILDALDDEDDDNISDLEIDGLQEEVEPTAEEHPEYIYNAVGEVIEVINPRYFSVLSSLSSDKSNFD
jgi:hypothetical protein